MTTSHFFDIKPMYMLPDSSFIPEVLIPCFRHTINIECMTGYFSSNALASLAPGLATFLHRSNGKLRLMVSPFLTTEDRNAIEDGLLSPDSAAYHALKNVFDTEDFIVKHSLKCFSWLLSVGRLEMKVALVKNALFHPKAWIFHFEGVNGEIAVHGSANMTYPGINRNIEQVTVSKSWENDHGNFIVSNLTSQFAGYWSGQSEECITVGMPDAITERLLSDHKGNNPPTERDLHELYSRAALVTRDRIASSSGRRPQFELPDGLNFTEGDYEHQGRAVNAWCEASYQGILAMATGSGKTNTAMVCARRLFDEVSPLLIVVGAPYRPLVQQWCAEMESFGLTPVNFSGLQGRVKRGYALERIGRRLRLGRTKVEAIVTTHKALSDDAFTQQLEALDCYKLLVADEVHNLGSEGFMHSPPDFFDHRLGLSATPERQYDDAGTQDLFSFFGPVVFEFTLEEAIGRCLVEYDYYIHRVNLTDAEMDDWIVLTDRIKANIWRETGGEPSEYVRKLLRDRRAILENAEGKVEALARVLEDGNISDLRHTLIYTSDKNPDQLITVNKLMADNRVLYHQVTAEETTDMTRTQEILESFQRGELQVLTAKRVLDEGVNIPQVRKAFILASTTVERQWTQRRGRLLRRCPEIGKTHSEIHDFVALPPEIDGLDTEWRPLLRAELRRAQEFAALARNAGRPDGPLKVIRQMVAAFM